LYYVKLSDAFLAVRVLPETKPIKSKTDFGRYLPISSLLSSIAFDDTTNRRNDTLENDEWLYSMYNDTINTASFQIEATEENVRTRNLPRHIAFICDGNTRWGKQQHEQQQQQYHSLNPFNGHFMGGNRTIEIIRSVQTHKLYSKYITHLTFYTFSTENWNRSSNEIYTLFRIIEQTARKAAVTTLFNIYCCCCSCGVRDVVAAAVTVVVVVVEPSMAVTTLLLVLLLLRFNI
jgi:hypothetical protein